MKILADQVFATLGLPWDSKLSNLVLDEDRMIVESIPEYLLRVDLNSRYLGLSPIILFPAGTYEINDFLEQCKNGPIYWRQYVFDTTIEDIGLVELIITAAQGIQGIAGGEQGPQGIIGSQGIIGEASQGTQGLQGDLGVQGRMGTFGLQGIQGLRGSQGLVGYGAQGALGDVTEVQGIQGNPGIQGHMGTVGLQGIQGLRGSQGTSIQGTQGLLGIQGFRGLQGIQGAAASGTFVQSVNAYDDPVFPISYLTYLKDGIQYPITEVPKPDGLVSGGYVSWVSELTFSTTLAAYYINGTFYIANSTQVTLDPADPTFSRIDVIIVDDVGQVLVIKGVPSVNPQKPSIDPETQIELTQILIPAGATEPWVDEQIIYDENVEWVGSVSGTTGNFAYTVAPFNGTYCTNITTISNGDTVTYTKTGTINTAVYSELVLYIKLKVLMSGQHNLYVRFLNGGALVSNEIVLPLLNKTNVTTWQTIIIPLSSFTFSSTIVNTLRFRWSKRGANTNHAGFYLDFIKFQGGIVQPPITGNIILTGDVSGIGVLGAPTTTTLATVNANVGQFGNSANIPQLTVDAKGRITSIQNILVDITTIAVSDEAPLSPEQGDGWFNTLIGSLFIWVVDNDLSGQWVEAVPSGSDGSDGSQGIQGAIGESVQGTFGIQGDIGTQGVQGLQGNTGIQGQEGLQGIIGSQGVQGIFGTQGQIGESVQGSAGYIGEDGSQGAIGSQGTAGYVGGDGAQGVTGSQGDTGSQGLLGSQGVQGNLGIQGEIGESIQGAIGSQGDLGIQGYLGVQGMVGSVGTFSVIPKNDGSFTLALTDAENYLMVNYPSGVTVTVPKNAVVDFPVPTCIVVEQTGNGAVTISPVDGDVAVNGYDGLTTYGQYAGLYLIQLSTNVWRVIAGVGF